MLKRFSVYAILVSVLVLPVTALADFGGTVTIPAGSTFDFDLGRVAFTVADIKWDVSANPIRNIVAVGNARLFNLGNLGDTNGFAAVSSSLLTQLTYPVTTINGNNDSTSMLLAGDVFAVVTNSGNYAKVAVLGYPTNASNPSLQDIQIRYYTYVPIFPHMVMGPLGSDVWTTAFILNNPTGSAASFDLDFITDSGDQMFLDSNNVSIETHQAGIAQTQSGSGVQGMIPASGTVTIVLSAIAFLDGFAALNGPGIGGQAVFHRHTSSGADYEAAVPLATGATEFLVPFDATTYFNGANPVLSLPYITGMALVNLDIFHTAAITCTILDLNGLVLGAAAPVAVPPFGHVALQLNAASGFGGVAGMIGSLDCTSTGSSFTILGLRFLGTNDLTSFAAVRLH
jgi:hypothetical protein